MNYDLFVDIYKKYEISIRNDMEIDDFVLINPEEYKEELYFKDPAGSSPNTSFFFDTDIYLFNILKSYNFSTNNIFKQLSQDFHRINYKINNTKITSKCNFINILQPYSNLNYENNGHVFPLNIILITLSLQSSFALPYFILTQEHPQDIFTGNKVKIRITIENTNIKFNLNVTFTLNNSSKKILNTTLNINTNLKNHFHKYAQLTLQ